MSTASNVSAVRFGQCTAGAQTITFAAVGRDSSGAGELIFVASCSLVLVALDPPPTIPPGLLTHAFPNLNALKLLFQNVTWANLGDSTGLVHSTTSGSLYVSLHTADPTGGSQTTSETTYTGYTRQAIARSSTGWAVA